MLCPPLLNPELDGILSNIFKTRDSKHTYYQTMVSKSLVAVGRALTTILNQDDKHFLTELKLSLLTDLSNSGRLLSHLFYGITKTRRQSPLLKNQVMTLLKEVPSGDFLFGPDLGENCKKLSY